MIKGQCLCGSVQYQTDALVSNMSNCHCGMCRKFHGAAYATYAQTKRKNFSWTAGEASIKAFKAENGTVRLFCVECGSSLLFEDDDTGQSELIHFAAGTLDTTVSEVPDRHIYVDSKAQWLHIEDDIDQYKKGKN